jgi:hypothetical protein
VSKTWPEDHPGRNCKHCGRCVYSLWIDDTPPPGTCEDGADADPAKCDSVRDWLVLATKLEAEGVPKPELALMAQHRLNITNGTVAEWAKIDAAIEAACNELRGTSVAIQIEELLDCDDAMDTAARGIALVKITADLVGQNVAFADIADEFLRGLRNVTHDVEHGQIDRMGGDE